MKAMILAAGVGSRLRPLTDETPKALLKVGNRTLLEIVLRRVASAGISSAVVNVHHFAGQVADYLKANGNFGMDISISDESAELLDTGGALRKASGFLADGEPVLVHNIDILSNLDLSALIAFHREKEALVTLAVKDRPTTRSLLIDGSGRLCGWEFPEKKICILTRDSKKGLKTTAFSGVYVFSPELLNRFPDEMVFGLMPWLLDLAATEKIITWDQSPAFWYEAGRLESLQHAAAKLVFDENDPFFIGEIC
jgi:NDP-sugar pyrophosphorylase family protein